MSWKSRDVTQAPRLGVEGRTNVLLCNTCAPAWGMRRRYASAHGAATVTGGGMARCAELIVRRATHAHDICQATLRTPYRQLAPQAVDAARHARQAHAHDATSPAPRHASSDHHGAAPRMTAAAVPRRPRSHAAGATWARRMGSPDPPHRGGPRLHSRFHSCSPPRAASCGQPHPRMQHVPEGRTP